MKKILVTGAKGQLGSELSEITRNYQEFDFEFHDIETLDLTDFDSVNRHISMSSPHYVINCAAYTAVDKAEEEQHSAYLLNEYVPANLADVCKKTGSKLIHISTDYVFDGKNYKPYTEEDITNPQSVYGKSKLNGEQKIMADTEAIIIRTSWLYSRFGKNFLQTMLRLGNEKDNIKVVFDQVGSPTNARDLAMALMELIAYAENHSFLPGIYHFSNEGVCSWYDFAHAIIRFKKMKACVLPITTSEYPLPAPRPHYSVLDKKKIRQAFGINIPHWQDSLLDLLNNLE